MSRDKTNWPDWLKQAKISDDAIVTIDNAGAVTWHGGTWKGGAWKDGTWFGGTWKGGTWKDGTWFGGTWGGGTWKGGTWGGGTWGGGRWEGGAWKDGTWKGIEDRMLYMASMIGIVFKDGYATAYRTTFSSGRGRFKGSFVQPVGEYYENNCPPPGTGCCTKGIHVTTADRAWSYFGIDPKCQFWEVRFKKGDLLDCDGQKARIRGGVFTKIDRPF